MERDTLNIEKIKERIKMVEAMEYICRQLNDEEIFELWLIEGVADGDIDYGSFFTDDYDIENLIDYVEENERFSDLMHVFLTCMKLAFKSGGLYCDGVLS